jgi:hypothetical protein
MGGFHGEIACRPAMGDRPVVGPWQVPHCESSVWSAWVVSSQFLLVVLHVAMGLKPLQLASFVHPLVPLGKPSTVGGSMMAVVSFGSTPPSGRSVPAKKTLSWQVPQAARAGLVIHASSTWQLVQAFSIATDAGSAIPAVPPVGIAGKPTFRKAASEVSALKPYSGWAAPGASWCSPRCTPWVLRSR